MLDCVGFSADNSNHSDDHENHGDHIMSYHDDPDSSADNGNWDTTGGHFRTPMTTMMATLVPVIL